MVIYTEGSLDLEEAWNLDREDREIFLETFQEFMKAKNPKAKGKNPRFDVITGINRLFLGVLSI